MNSAGGGAARHFGEDYRRSRLVRRGNDLVMVAELAGHQKLETTRRYTLPSAADRQAAVEDLQIDY